MSKAFQLTKTELKERSNLIAAMTETGMKLTEAVKNFNAATTAAWELVDRAQKQHNVVVTQAQEFVGTIYEDRAAIYAAKDQEWEDSDAGQAAFIWLEEWAMNLTDSDLDQPDEITVSDLAGQELEELPTEP